MATLGEITYQRGDTDPIAITVKSDGVPVDITGWVLTLTVNTEKAPVDDTNQVFQLTGILDADPTTGRVSFQPTEVQTDLVGTYYYDIQRVDASGFIKTIQPPTKIKFAQDITKI